jgi:hypothetical protein
MVPTKKSQQGAPNTDQAVMPEWRGEAPISEVDWQILCWRVHAVLAKSDTHGREPLLFLRLGSYWSEPIQDAVARTFRVWARGGERPTTQEDLAYIVARRARHIDDKRRGQARAEKRAFFGSDPEIMAVLYGARTTQLVKEICTPDLFDEICDRNLLRVFLRELTNMLDVEARAVLTAVVIDGVPIGDTKALAKVLGSDDVAAVQNIKRRIKYKAEPLLRWLSGDCVEGGGNG